MIENDFCGGGDDEVDENESSHEEGEAQSLATWHNESDYR